jgi:hypothetical protein
MIYVPDLGKYFIFGSYLTGWNPNDNVYSTATSLSGPWSEWKGFTKAGSLTYTSQTNFILPLGGAEIAGHTGKRRQAIVWMGDRWDSTNLMRSTYVWLPLEIEEPNGEQLHVAMHNLKTWNIDARTGYWDTQVTKALNFEAENTKLLGNAKAVRCDLCKSRSAVEILEGNGIRIENIQSPASLRGNLLFYYEHDGSGEQFATLQINDGPYHPIAFLPSGNFTTDGVTKGTFISSTVELFYKGGNTLELKGSKGCKIVLDKVEIMLV